LASDVLCEWMQYPMKITMSHWISERSIELNNTQLWKDVPLNCKPWNT
jgi:hypothetical protein